MKLVPWLRIAKSSFVPVLVGTGALASAGCGGATFDLGNVPVDGGKDSGSSHGIVNQPPCADCNGGGGAAVADAGTLLSFSDGCSVASLGCAAGATGYACAAGDDPSSLAPTSICTRATLSGDSYDYCCTPWPSGSGCVPDPGFPCGFNSYALECQPSLDPTAIEPGLQCGESFLQSNGDLEFCCTGS